MVCNIKLCGIFMIMIFMNGCEKKAELPVQMQTATFVTENSVGNESVGPEEDTQEKLVNDWPIVQTQEELNLDEFAEETQVRLTVRRLSPFREDSIDYEYVDRNITELEFFKCSLIGLEGLGQLKFLDTIVFDKCSDLRDFSFLAEVPQLRRLFIENNTGLNIDWNFVKQLPNLEVLYVDSSRQPSINIDLKNNENLEYIGFTGGVLDTFPTLFNVPSSLKYLNLESNRITSLPSNFDIYNHITVFLGINPFRKDATTPSNITTDFFSGISEQKYRLPTSITPRISDLR